MIDKKHYKPETEAAIVRRVKKVTPYTITPIKDLAAWKAERVLIEARYEAEKAPVRAAARARAVDMVANQSYVPAPRLSADRSPVITAPAIAPTAPNFIAPTAPNFIARAWHAIAARAAQVWRDAFPS